MRANVPQGQPSSIFSLSGVKGEGATGWNCHLYPETCLTPRGLKKSGLCCGTWRLSHTRDDHHWRLIPKRSQPVRERTSLCLPEHLYYFFNLYPFICLQVLARVLVAARRILTTACGISRCGPQASGCVGSVVAAHGLSCSLVGS